jgi:hypothetical protein
MRKIQLVFISLTGLRKPQTKECKHLLEDRKTKKKKNLYPKNFKINAEL